MTQDFAPNSIKMFDLIAQIEYSDLKTDADKAEFAYRAGLRDALRTQNIKVAAELPEEYGLDGETEY